MAMADAEGSRLPGIEAQERYVVQHTFRVDSLVKHADASLPIGDRLYIERKAVFGVHRLARHCRTVPLGDLGIPPMRVTSRITLLIRLCLTSTCSPGGRRRL